MQDLRFVGNRMALTVATIALTMGCGKRPDQLSEVAFDGAHSVALDGVIEAGKLIATTADVPSIKREIIEQVWYTTGQLNAIGGVADMARTEVKSVTVGAQRPDGRYEVTYAAKLFLSWPRERAIPSDLLFVLPSAGDPSTLATFFQEYGSDEHGAKRCLSAEAHDVSQGILWYHYRPLNSTCPLATGVDDDLSRRFPMHFALSAENTNGKSPEYAKIWEDGKLVVTAIFGKFESGATAASDPGIGAFRQTYSDLLAKFGNPTSTNLAPGENPDATHDDIRLTFNTVSGPLDIHLYLVNGIREVDSAFVDKYNARTKISDFVSYSGHSGLGANIRALAQMGQFVKGQYQIFLVNGCDTFAYVASDLRDAHKTANPEAGPDKYFDMITNAMPSYFSMNSRANLAVIGALVEKQQTYRQILAGFDQSQRAAVTGEQDNGQPF